MGAVKAAGARPSPVKEPTVRDFWQWTRGALNETAVDSHEIRAGVLILACHRCGPRIQRLRHFTNIPTDEILNVSYRMRQAKLWGNGWFRAPWLDDDFKNWPVDFTMFVLTATGQVVARSPEEFKCLTVADVFQLPENQRELGGAAIPWRDLVPVRPLMRSGAEQAQTVPWWVRKSDA